MQERFVAINIREAYLLADLAGIRDDLATAEAICNLLLKEEMEIKEDTVDFTVTQALSTAALISYARVFKTSVRAKGLPNKIKKLLPEKFHDKHQWAINLRDKYVAHSVNAFEDNQVVASLFPEEHEHKGIFRITVRRSRLGAIGNKNVLDIRALCTTLMNEIDKLIKEEQDKVLEAARRIPIDQLYALQPTSNPLPNRSDVDKRRKQK
jgi:hypothetical protein